ncbi:MmpS family transport accessory protein [Streptomyces sp. NPDC050619]|uniref:MmpS family transport accessory protein n=1 Tax=Streptomyces sp. NPDC050619 TaxID=3157214 RepID=UPI0034279B96
MQKSATDATITDAAAEKPVRSRRADRAGLIAGAAVLAACSGLVLYGVLDSDQGEGEPEHRAPTASVTYEVTGEGTADISYQARDESGKATVVKAAALPWHATVDVPLGQDPIVSIVLGEKGGQARCTVAVRGRHVQSATATGTFGRATCSGTLPGTDATGG